MAHRCSLPLPTRGAFSGAVVGLGVLGGSRTTSTSFRRLAMRQDVYQNLPISQLEDHFDDIVSSAYSVSLLTNWQSERVNQVWLKRPVTDGATFELGPDFYGATLATTHLHPIAGLSPEACTEQMGIPGPWYDRLPHFRMGFTPSSGEELQSEYLVPRPHAVAAFRAIYGLRAYLAPLLLISEVRTIAADELWMSPCTAACVGLHLRGERIEKGQALLSRIEEELGAVDARPHWGTLFTMPVARVQSLYSKLRTFNVCSFLRFTGHIPQRVLALTFSENTTRKSYSGLATEHA